MLPSQPTEGPAATASGAAHRARLTTSLVHAVALGGLAGAAQAASVYRTHYMNGAFAWASRDIFWMAPVSNALLLAVLSMALWGVARVWPRGVRQHVVDGVLASMAALAILLLIGGLHEGAVLALAIGLGAQHGRMARSGSKLVRFGIAAGLVAGLVLVAGGLVARATRDGRDGVAQVAPAPAGAPNVLLIIWDTVRAMSVSLYGSERRTTPELERFAASATTFDWAIAPSPWTLPSHCSMFTGLQPGEHSCRWDDPLRGEPTTVAAEFAKRGWRTGAFVANHFYTTHETGLERGFTRFEDFQVTLRQLLLSSPLAQTAPGRDLARGTTWRERLRAIRQGKLRGDPKPLNDRKLAVTVTDDFLAWQAREPAQPWFAFLNLFDAHDPYEPPPPWDRAFPDAPARLAQYEGGIAYMDHELGRLLRELEGRGMLENTIVVVTSDHGEAFGEHGLNNHGHALYMPLVHVPLVIHAPARLAAGTRVPAAIALRDLAATLLDLAGIGPVAGIAGSSFAAPGRLAVASEDAVDPARVALAETEKSKVFWLRGPARDGAMHALVDDHWHYIRDGRGGEELFAYRSDAAEATNLAASDSARTARYRALLGRVTTRLVR
jgi:arylsulfatase A-like enzyme